MQNLHFILKELGFKTYKQYLRSDLWQNVREKVFRLNGRQCWCCTKKAKVIHHLKYTKRSLTGKSVDNLVPLCRKCHYKIHFKKNGAKRSTNESLHVFKSIKRNISKKEQRVRRALESSRCIQKAMHNKYGKYFN